MNTSYGFAASAEGALRRAVDEASALGHTYTGSEHILLGILRDGGGAAATALAAFNVSYKSVLSTVITERGRGSVTALDGRSLTANAREVIGRAFSASREEKKENQKSCITAEHLLIALLRVISSSAYAILTAAGVNGTRLEAELKLFLSNARQNDYIYPESRKLYGAGRLPSGKDACLLSEYSRDLCAAALSGTLFPVIGRDSETEQVMSVLMKKSKCNPVLIGEPGVGKTAIAEGLALRIAEKRVPGFFIGKRIISLDTVSLVAGTKYRGDFEERIKSILTQASSDPDIILFIDEIHTLIGAGGAEGTVDAASAVKPMLARGELRLIGATTVTEYRKIEKDGALERRFVPVTVGEPDIKSTADILRGICPSLERHHNLRISDRAVNAAVELSDRFMCDRRQPDKSIDLLDGACALARLKNSLREPFGNIQSNKELLYDALRDERYDEALAVQEEIYGRERENESILNSSRLCVGEEEIRQLVTKRYNIPESACFKAGELSLLAGCRAALIAGLSGQEDSARAAASALFTGLYERDNSHTPLCVMLFTGSPGNGQRECSEIIAECLFRSADTLFRLDMSEYTEAQSISKLIGSPPGYIGYDEGGRLTGKLRRHPCSVIVFDGIEKAHPDICEIITEIAQTGYLTDSSGVAVCFRNTVLIMCENTKKYPTAGFSEKSAENTGQYRAGPDTVSVSGRLLSLTHGIIHFSAPGKESVTAAVRKYTAELANKLKEDGTELEFADTFIFEASRRVLKSGFGARAVKKEVLKPLDKLLLLLGQADSGRFIAEFDTVTNDFVIIPKMTS